ncbi:hypothetical protein EDD18DRAFT_1105474 [Armillaria luteobubalina]|uniref:Uncharacterized protein n=1 Tax=Armillaria luteobubalina TaxID=153913 RepID=A0AA39Q6Z6_9AGAR|nr:hypothetical protein EDD18DRAFT_1105474 [Armillaria luteobubalina]
MESASLEGGQAGSSLAILEGKEELAGERQAEGQIDECQAMKRQPLRPVPESLLSENVGQVIEEELVEWTPVEDGPDTLQEEKDVKEALIMLQPVVALFDGIKSQAEAVSELEDPPSTQSIIRASDFSSPERVVIVAISRSDMLTKTALEQYSDIYKDFQPLASRDTKIYLFNLVEGLKAISLKEVQLQSTVNELHNHIKEKDLNIARHESEDKYMREKVRSLQSLNSQNIARRKDPGKRSPDPRAREISLSAPEVNRLHEHKVVQYANIKAGIESLQATHQEAIVELQGNIKEKEEAMAHQASRSASLSVTALEEVYATNESLQATVQQVSMLIPPSYCMNLKNSQLQADIFKHGDDKRVLESHRMELQAKMESLEAAHQETGRETERMVETVLQLCHTIHETQAENASFRNDLQGVHTANESLLRTNERELGLKQTEWQSEMNELTKSFGSQIDTKNREMITCQDKLKNTEIQQDQLVNRYNDLKEHLNTIENNIRHNHTERPVMQKEWNNAFETVEPQVWEAMVKLRNELSSKLAKAQSNMKQMRKHIQDLQNQKMEVQQVGESIIKPDINHTKSAERPQCLDLHIPTECSSQSEPAINSPGFWQNTMFTFQMGARADDHEPLDSCTEGHPVTDTVNILNLQSNSSIPILPGVGVETDTASTRSRSSVSSAMPSGMSHFSGLATDREGADIAGGKMKYNKNSLTPRNFCAKDWCEAHKGGTVVQFRHHWNTLSPLEREKYKRISQNAKVAKSNKPEVPLIGSRYMKLNEEVAVS